MTPRPSPPSEDILPPWLNRFQAAPELATWVSDTFLDMDSPLYNEEHAHLEDFDIGWLWAAKPASNRNRTVLGQARLVSTAEAKWSQQMALAQIEDLLGRVPDGIVTICAEYARMCDDDAFCALIEHELYHFGQAEDENGPRFNRDGLPVIELRGHDIEEFVGVVRRYGVVDGSMNAMAKALADGPQIARVSVAQACGTCNLRAVA